MPEAPGDIGFDFYVGDASLGGFVGLISGPSRWYWAAVVGQGLPYLLVRDLEVEPARRGQPYAVRATGLWADHDHEGGGRWSINLEAFAVALDDPDEALAGERGTPTALGLDIEFEPAGPRDSGDQPGTVHGDLLVAERRISLDGYGWQRADPTAPGFHGHDGGGRPITTDGHIPGRRALLLLGDGRGVVERQLCAVPGGGAGWRTASYTG